MHQVFITPGLILAKRGVGESNTTVTLLTRELGLIRASARSARKEVSKLRFGLEPLTTARFSLVRGRSEWKLVGVESVSRAYVATSTERRRQEGRISKLLLRLIHGEEPVFELYDTIIEGLAHLTKVGRIGEASNAAYGSAEAQTLECLLVLRIVDHLGYVSLSPDLAPFLEGSLSSPDLLTKAATARPTLIRTINESLSATGL